MTMDSFAAAAAMPTAPAARQAGPCAMVIFGAAGDLTRRLVVPALYNLMAGTLLPDQFMLIGVDMAALSTEQWRARLTEMMQSFLHRGGEFEASAIDMDAWSSLMSRAAYLQGNLDDATAFNRLVQRFHRTTPIG